MGDVKTIFRGSTPTIYFDLPVDASLLQAIYITFAQNGVTVIEKTIADVTREGNTVACQLSQADTLALEGDSVVEVQLRWKMPGGNTMPTKPAFFEVGSILKDGLI
jgi:hypothetical protein